MARLEALADMVDEVEQSTPSPEARQAQAEQQKDADSAEQGARDWALMMFTLGGMACMIEPELKQVYAEDRCLNWGAHANQVAIKYGWGGPSNMPELALLASTATFFVPTYFLLRAKLAQVREGKATGLMAKVGVWWRARRARREAADANAPEKGGGDGSEQ
jgi:hypothetical protein